MIQKIITIDDEGGEAVLAKRCDPVPADPKVFVPLFHDLLDTALWASRKHDMGCIGLSANQIGQSYTAFVMRWGNVFLPIMNPEIVSTSAQTAPSREGCLSLPNRPRAVVTRFKWVVLRWTDPDTLEGLERKFKKVDARVIQHEMDHAAGILI